MRNARNMRNTRKKQTNTSGKKKFVKLNCSPITNSAGKQTCFSKEDLEQMRQMWNARHSDHKITSHDPNIIWNHLKSYYMSICNKESCWVRQMMHSKEQQRELLDAFAPEAPKDWDKNPNEWLSSMDILRVMNQYEQRYKCFDFIGPSPIDYDHRQVNGQPVWKELCFFDLNDHIRKGHFKIGIIFNLDKHTGSGTHWVSMFINVKKKIIFYFDSTGDAIPPQIMKFARTVMEQGKSIGIDFAFDQNHPVEHQYSNTECGMYSLFFIIHMVEDKITSHYLKKHIVRDKDVEKFRRIYFNRAGSL